ncbi:MAG TPA: alpha/beta hydrolase [Solirubrobacterales bacterium]|nr:alpha/beta hydrolase [Solirubrobacterales bacterium]
MNLPRRVVWTVDRHLVSRSFTLPPRLGRALVEGLSFLDPMPKGVDVRHGSVAGSTARIIVPDGAPEAPRVVWIHGGGFVLNSPRVYTTFVAYLARALGASVIMPTYRRAPEHPFPAAVEDSLAAYRSIAADCGPLVLAGDSAGGNLALNIAIALRDAGDEPPAGLLLMSPWVDLSQSGESVRVNDGKDAILRASDVARKASSYAAGADFADSQISPLNAELSGLPPTLIQCGSDELFVSEGSELAARMETAKTPVELDVTDGMWHDFQTHAAMLPEAAAAVARMASWAKPLFA